MTSSRVDLAALDRVVAWLGLPWTSQQTDQLVRFTGWLAEEGAAIGGIGPEEAPRVWDRHVLDSLVFAVGFAGTGAVLDVGSGIGLPGIPLAIALPRARLHLLDRSGRRTDALHRVSRILQLHVAIHRGDVNHHHDRYSRVVLRAALTVEATLDRIPRLLDPDGDIVFGLGRGEEPDALERWRRKPADAPQGMEVELLSTPGGVLDSTSWLLRMTAQ